MLKKAGIVVATAAAALLAVSPLAFATEGGDHRDHHDPAPVTISETNSATCGFVNASDVNNTQTGTATGISLLGAALPVVLQTLVPATVVVQAIAPIASCNNIDLGD